MSGSLNSLYILAHVCEGAKAVDIAQTQISAPTKKDSPVPETLSKMSTGANAAFSQMIYTWNFQKPKPKPKYTLDKVSIKTPNDFQRPNKRKLVDEEAKSEVSAADCIAKTKAFIDSHPYKKEIVEIINACAHYFKWSPDEFYNPGRARKYPVYVAAHLFKMRLKEKFSYAMMGKIFNIEGHLLKTRISHAKMYSPAPWKEDTQKLRVKLNLVETQLAPLDHG